MKKVIQEPRTVEVCDVCQLQHDTTKCYGCGKEVCRDCRVHYGFGIIYEYDYFLCKKCNDNPNVDSRILQIRLLLNQCLLSEQQYKSMKESMVNQFDHIIDKLNKLDLRMVKK